MQNVVQHFGILRLTYFNCLLVFVFLFSQNAEFKAKSSFNYLSCALCGQRIAFYSMPAPYLSFECQHNITLNNTNHNNFTVAERVKCSVSCFGFPLLPLSCLKADVSSKQVRQAGERQVPLEGDSWLLSQVSVSEPD